MYKQKFFFVTVLTFFIYSLSCGQTQPEFASYEAFGGTQMVQKNTGDFVYNIPLMNVPGSNGGFPVQLSYHAGIKHRQEASWVGLGWTLNLGAINRQVNQYPDDASGASLVTEIHKDSKVYVSQLVDETNINFNKSFGVPSIPALGTPEFKYRKGPTIGFGPALSTMGPPGINYEYAVLQSSMNNLIGGGNQANDSEYAGSSGVGFNSTSFFSMDKDDLKKDEIERLVGWKKILGIPYWPIIKTCTRYFFDQDTTEKIYGALYQDEMSYGIDHNKVSDLYQHQDHQEYYKNMDPVYLARDNYMVMGGSASGSIEPVRFDNPSLVYPIAHISNNNRPHVITYNITEPQTQKPQFIYPGEHSNTYKFHLEQGKPANINKNIVHHYTTQDGDVVRKIIFNNVDQSPSIDEMEDSRYGFDKSKARLSKGKHVEWFTNSEIADLTAREHGFINHTDDFDRSDQPNDGVGGFMVTTKSGVTYHYTIPVYVKSRISKSYTSDGTENSSITLNHDFANTWILTAITGPDFVDRGTIGVIDEADYGHYVKFDYGKFADDFKIRQPYNGTYYDPSKLNSRNYQKLVVEKYYLNKIVTPTHVALFVKDYRKDGKSKSYKDSYSDLRFSLSLKEIILLKKEDFNYLRNDLGFSYSHEDSEHNLHELHMHQNVLLADDIEDPDPVLPFLHEKQLKRIVFETDYQLCQNTPNSFDFSYLNGNPSAGDRSGKLTLKKLFYYGRNDVLTKPGYSFYYGNNPDFGGKNWDGWGYYSYDANDRKIKEAGKEGTVWNLTSILTPLRNMISIKYERDKYHAINNHELTEPCYGGGIRVSEISMSSMEDGQDYSVIYNYNNSGVCTQEPLYARLNSDYEFYNHFETPGPAIVYGNVSEIQKGKNTEILSKKNYEFVTPSEDFLTVSDHHPNPDMNITVTEDFYANNNYHGVNYNQKSYLAVNKTDKIGLPLKTSSLNKFNQIQKEINYHYVQSDELGIITQGANLVESIYREDNIYNNRKTYRLINTVTKKHPTYLKSITYQQGGTIKQKVYSDHDFITGIPLTIKKIAPKGDVYITKKVPAYKIYDEMGPRSEDCSKKNMLTQLAASYKLFQSNEANGSPKVMNAAIQTWNKEWKYREKLISPENHLYTDSIKADVWRKHKQFAWVGELDADGSYKNFSLIDESDVAVWDSLNSETEEFGNWIKTNEITRYNHNSIPLESKDINGKYSASRKNVNNRKTIVNSSNASYEEFTYCGFENVAAESDNNGNLYFDGEVKVNPDYNERTTSFKHTGSYSLKTNPGEKAVEYTIPLSNSACEYDYPYRLSVWFKPLDPSDFDIQVSCLYAVENNHSGMNQLYNEQKNFYQEDVQQFGEWYLLNYTTKTPDELNFNLEDAYVFTVCINNKSDGIIYFDDFRVHPLDATVESYAYDHNFGKVQSHLDYQNIATTYSFDNSGRLEMIYKETPVGFKKGKEFDIYYHDKGTGEICFIKENHNQGGTVNVPQACYAGVEVKANIIPDEAHYINQVFLDGVPVGTENNFHFTASKNHEIEVEFKRKVYDIQADHSDGGLVSPAGNQQVYHGDDLTFRFIPDVILSNTGSDGNNEIPEDLTLIENMYEVKNVKLDGEWIGARSSYTFNNVKESHEVYVEFQEKTFIISESHNNGGSVSPSGTNTYQFGMGVEYSFMPDNGYKVINVIVDGDSKGNISTYSFSDLISDHNLDVTFGLINYNLDVTGNTGGSVSLATSAPYHYGDEVQVNISTNEGYYLDKILLNGNSVTPVKPFTFTVENDHEVEVVFKKKKYDITIDHSSGGSISPSGNQQVYHGEDLILQFTPDVILSNTGSGGNNEIPEDPTLIENMYEVKNVKIDGEWIGARSSYTFNNVKESHEVYVEFQDKTFTISETHNNGGSVSPSGTNTYQFGMGVEYSFMPDNGYKVENVIVDGDSKGNISTYSFSDLISDHNLDVTFGLINYNLYVTGSTGGSVTLATSAPYHYGDEVQVNISTNEGYYLDKILLDGNSVTPVKPFTFTVEEDHDVEVDFKKKKYEITIDHNSGGSISPSGNQQVYHGDDLTLQFTPDVILSNTGSGGNNEIPEDPTQIESMYEVKNVKIDGEWIGARSSYTFNNVKESHEVYVEFQEKTLTISESHNNGGFVSPSGTNTYQFGMGVVYHFNPHNSFEVENVKVDGQSKGAISSYTFNNIDADHTISVLVIPDDFKIGDGSGF